MNIGHERSHAGIILHLLAIMAAYRDRGLSSCQWRDVRLLNEGKSLVSVK